MNARLVPVSDEFYSVTIEPDAGHGTVDIMIRWPGSDRRDEIPVVRVSTTDWEFLDKAVRETFAEMGIRCRHG